MNISALSPARLAPQAASFAGSDAPDCDTNGDVARAMPVLAREGEAEKPYLPRATKTKINRLVHAVSLQYSAALTDRIYAEIDAARTKAVGLAHVLAAADTVLAQVAHRASEQNW